MKNYRMDMMSLSLLALSCIGLAACSGGMNANQTKSDFVAQSSVLSSGSNGSASGTIVQPGGGTTGTIVQPGGGGPGGGGPSGGGPGGAGLGVSQPSTNAPGGSIPVGLICSDRGSSQTTSYQAAVAANDPISLDVNGQTCTSNVSTITTLLESKSISVATLAGLCPSLVPASGTVTLSLLINGEPQSDSYNNGSQTLTVIWTTNPQQTTGAAPAGSQYCTQDASPLVIHIPQDPGIFQSLNLSPANAIYFDLLGATDNHRRVKIDWFTNLDYRLLALPNQNGQVLGIDQLFGNNTTGPDGRTSANGYAALAKYDDNHDGVIDARDAVFPYLRVWLDRNFDGIAQPDELVALEDVGITSIDLDYTNSYPEVDQYGNQTLMKSVVNLSNGTLDLIFDLWFAYTQ